MKILAKFIKDQKKQSPTNTKVKRNSSRFRSKIKPVSWHFCCCEWSIKAVRKTLLRMPTTEVRFHRAKLDDFYSGLRSRFKTVYNLLSNELTILTTVTSHLKT